MSSDILKRVKFDHANSSLFLECVENARFPRNYTFTARIYHRFSDVFRPENSYYCYTAYSPNPSKQKKKRKGEKQKPFSYHAVTMPMDKRSRSSSSKLVSRVIYIYLRTYKNTCAWLGYRLPVFVVVVNCSQTAFYIIHPFPPTKYLFNRLDCGYQRRSCSRDQRI